MTPQEYEIIENRADEQRCMSALLDQIVASKKAARRAISGYFDALLLALIEASDKHGTKIPENAQ
ncbi:DNA-binding FrmR family transcriptional regulator [Inquilinus ginsengisoli]|uniref:DNA-binding FrmR family transcriptional regulator n=1 Tax=Inquilinus ginsengisoli TaxID=363840 RepID=A0ABU1JJ25_9PROT|nr:hypothetical protein [Inquilinus ginsengisoli]MDR6288616.1 DNA-binding FrmR family transcriptional regulator [Inquilinus ginsengisoli]